MIRFPSTLAGRRRLLLWVASIALLGGILMIPFGVRVYALRDRHAVGPSWRFPSRVYSDAVLLIPGRLLPSGYVAAQLTARGYRRTPRPEPIPGTWATSADGIHVSLRGFRDAASPYGHGGPENVLLRIADGHLVGVERRGGVEGAPPPDLEHPPHFEPVPISLLFDEQRMRRSYVTLDRVPRVVQDAIVASEDRRFFGHWGLDVRANLRALIANLRARGVREGGSTITQQLARGLFLGRERTLPRKAIEVVLATGLEILLTKQQILEMYLNSVYWGQSETYGIGGIAEAAQWYFAAPVESLGLAEGATLAAMIPSPNTLSPFEKPAEVLTRRNAVLEKMVETKRLDPEVAARAAALPLTTRRGPQPVVSFPSFDGYVRQALGDRLPRHAAEGWGLSIFTTMDLAWQIAAEAELERGLASLGGRKLQAAFVALEPTTGAVRAVVGGRDLAPGDFNRATQARRQTGSAIKPIVYAAAFAGEGGGASFTPATTVADTPRVFGRGRWAWKPRNFDGTYHSSVTLAKALASSLNVATTNVVDAIGPGTVARMAERFGLGRLKAVPSIGLGSNETTLLALTNAFAVFAAEGMRHDPSPLVAVVDGRGKHVLRSSERGVEVVPSSIAALMTGLLEDVVLYGVGSPLRTVYGFDRPVAGKTGTTNDFHDAWFVGFVPYLAAGVWVGYDRPRSIGRQAAHSALPLWARIMRRMVGGFPPLPFATDTQLQWASIEPWTGYLADSTCAGMEVPFLPGTAPRVSCSAGTMEYGEYVDSLDADSSWADLDSDSTAIDDTLDVDQPTEPWPEPEPDPEPEPPAEPEPDTLSTP